MKTKKVRPVLVKSKKPTNILLSGFGTLFITPPMKPKSSDIYQQLILISLEDEKIEVGNLAYRLSTKVLKNMSKTANWFSCGWRKVIATQDQLSPELVQQLVDEYNNGGMKDFEIEMENYSRFAKVGIPPRKALCSFPNEFRPKLTNGFVTVVDKEKSTRKQAMKWWNKQTTLTQIKCTSDFISKERNFATLTGREIETIWRQWHEDFVSKAMGDNKELVDFEMLKYSLPMFEACVDNCQPEWNKYTNNLKLFFQKLSESGSFAHKAHKELQRLNK
jgi:hypothetical protein